MKLITLFSVLLFFSCSNEIKNLDISCGKSNFEACNKLATKLFKAKNKEGAMIYYQIACNGGNQNSCTSLGILQYERKNFLEARRLFKEACKKGNNDSCINLKKLGFTSSKQ